MLPSLVFFSILSFVQAVTVYHGQIPLALTSSAQDPITTAPAYNNTRLLPPTIPIPPPSNVFTLTLQQNAANVSGLSIPHVGGCLWGFSIEMSVISQVRKSNFLLLFIYLIISLFKLAKTRTFKLIFYNKKPKI
jgi:hypothetical protein